MTMTWKALALSSTWPEFRDWVLDRDCLQTVNLPWWKEQYNRLRAEETPA